MLFPEKDTFLNLAKAYNRIVVYREIAGDLITPISLLKNFSDEKHLFLLESANLDKSFSRYTYFGFTPQKVITYKNKVLRCESEEHGVEQVKENPIDYLTRQLEGVNSYKEVEFGDFCGGFVGFMGYDMVNYMGILRQPVKEDTENLSMAFFQINEFYVFDNHMGKLYAACSVNVEGDASQQYMDAEQRTLEMATEILNMHMKNTHTDETLKQRADFDEASFIDAVKILKKEIVDGECIQVVLSNKYEIASKINPVNLYRTMRNINPSPYMFYIKVQDDIICGTSPEIHLKISDNTAILKPIAGTYKYNKNNLEEIKEKLLNDEKENAEHLMLLDLARNDLYTGCEHESVHLVSSFKPEVYSHVVHIVSEVQGKIRNDVSPVRLFCNTFPAGTVSGAPKVRAMELIDQYEHSPRGFYAGCAGYFSYSQDVDTCIIIRSAFVNDQKLVLRAGAGIVYDSVPETEYKEVGIKLGAAFDALKQLQTLEKKNVFND